MKFFRLRNCSRFKVSLAQQVLSFCVGFLLACLLTVIPQNDSEEQMFCDRSWLRSEILQLADLFKNTEQFEDDSYEIILNASDVRYSADPDARYWKAFDDLRNSYGLPRSSIKHPRILCWIMTDPDILGKARAAQLTWLSKCDIPLIFSSKQNNAFPTIGLKVPSGRKSIAAKAHLAWEHVYEHYKDNADFFMKADPDSYVFVNNLKRFLSNRSPSHVGLYGHALYVDLSNHSFYRRFKGYYAAGEGYVMSKEALTNFMKVIDMCPLINGTAEDLKTSICLSMVGVDLTDTRDLAGRETFLPPLSLKNIAISSLPKWYMNKYRRYIGYCSNLTCLSAYPIVTHYVRKSEMYVFEYMSRVIDELTDQINITGSPNFHFNGLLHLRPQYSAVNKNYE